MVKCACKNKFLKEFTMLYEKILLSEAHPDCVLTTFVHEESSEPRKAVIVCPGGGYRFLSVRESFPIAEFFYNNGINAYILEYSVESAAKDLAPLIQVALAVKYVRENAEAHNTDPHKIVTCGFSAGGHVAASAGVLWNLPEVRDAMGITSGACPEGINRPDGMILSYPVITAGKYAHQGSISRVAGKAFADLTDDDIRRFSLECNVDPTTPPMFIWHTYTDNCVPVQNSVFMINAYLENNIKFEAHIYPQGPHGLSLANKVTWEGHDDKENPHVETWACLAVMWLEDMFK